MNLSYACILVNRTILITRARAVDDAKRVLKRDKGVIFETCVPFTNCMSKINNNLIDNAKDLNVAKLMYNLIEYNDNYSKTSASIWAILLRWANIWAWKYSKF